MKKFLKSSSLIFGLAVFVAFGAGCSDDDENTPMAPDMGAGAMLRVIHGSPDAPPVDVYVEGVSAPIISSLSYGETAGDPSGGYLEVDPGDYNIQLRGAGADPSSQPVYETGVITIPEGAKITALAAGSFSSMSADEQFRVIPLVENFVDAGGNAIVRIVHASPDAPTVAIDVGNDAQPEIPSLARFAETGEAGVQLPAGEELQIAIWAGSPLARVTVFTTPALPPGAEIFVIATGFLADLPRQVTGFSLLAVGPSGSIGFIRQNPVVFALHGSPDAPAVDIFAGQVELVDNLSFGELSGAIQVPPGSYDLDFRSHDNGPVAASVTTPELTAGQRYLAVATGFLNDQSFTVLPLVDELALSDPAARIRVLHASPDAPAVDVGTVDGMGVLTAVPDYTDVEYTESSVSAGTSIPVAALTLGVAATGSTNPVATFDVTTAGGLRAFAVAAGSLQGTGEGFRLLIVNTGVFPWEAAEVLPNMN
jgi:hypothetical protein